MISKRRSTFPKPQREDYTPILKLKELETFLQYSPAQSLINFPSVFSISQSKHSGPGFSRYAGEAEFAEEKIIFLRVARLGAPES
jgi:hypothetical protein